MFVRQCNRGDTRREILCYRDAKTGNSRSLRASQLPGGQGDHLWNFTGREANSSSSKEGLLAQPKAVGSALGQSDKGALEDVRWGGPESRQ